MYSVHHNLIAALVANVYFKQIAFLADNLNLKHASMKFFNQYKLIYICTVQLCIREAGI